MITFTELRKFFLSLVFNPAKEGPMKVIVDVGDPHYYLTRALEMLQESRRDGLSHDEREVLRIRAIQLLALNILNSRTKTPKKRPAPALTKTPTPASVVHPEKNIVEDRGGIGGKADGASQY